MTAKEILIQDHGVQRGTELWVDLHAEISDCLINGGGYTEVSEILLEYGLEMDYIFEFI